MWQICGGSVSRGLVDASALMVVRYHDGVRHARSNDSPGRVVHREMDVESSLLSMVTAVACDAEGEDNGTHREIEDFRTVELYELRVIFMLSSSRDYCRFLDAFIVRSRWTDTRCNLPLYPFSL